MNMFSNVIMESFLGGDVREIKIDGMPAPKFFVSLISEAFEQILDLNYAIFGMKLVESGLRKKDR